MLSVKSTYVALEQLHCELEDEAGLEAYIFVHRTLDTFGRLLSNLETNLKHFNEKFKRSELAYFHDARRLLLLHADKLSYFDETLMVPKPSGMHATYLYATTTLDALYTRIDILASAEILKRYFEETVLTDPAQITGQISHITIAELSKTLNTVFNDQKTDEVPLSTVIKTHAELKLLDRHILAFETYYRQAEKVVALLHLVETAIDKHTKRLEDAPSVDRKFLVDLHSLVRAAAVQFDAYGVVLAEMQRVEHNFVMLYKKLAFASVNHG